MTDKDARVAGSPARVRSARWLPRLAVALCIATAFLLSIAQHSASAATRDDGNLTVEVIDDVKPTPSASSSPTPTSTPSSSLAAPAGPIAPAQPGAGSSAQGTPVEVTQATIPGSAGAEEALGEDTVSVGDVLTMSGLSAEASPSLDIGNGTVALSFVIRNSSPEVIDASARFWVNNEFGFTIAAAEDVRVDGLAPDETRRVQVRISGLGQHVVLHNFVTLTPPETVAGVDLEPITRNVTIAVPPVLTIAVVGGMGVLGGLAWWVFSVQGLGFRFGRWGL